MGTCIRYADDCVYILKPNDDADKLLQRIDTFLNERGMNVSAKKTRVTATTDGFNFPGWYFKVQSKLPKFIKPN